MNADLEAALLAERYDNRWWTTPERDPDEAMAEEIAVRARLVRLDQIEADEREDGAA